MSVSLKRTVSDGNFGSTSVGVMMEDQVLPGQKRSEVLNRLIEQEAAFIKAKLDELGAGTKDL